MRDVRVRTLVAALGILLGGAALTPVAANHGGPSVGSLLSCDRPVDPPRCVSVGNDRFHYVYIDASVPAALAESVRHAIAEYDTTTDLVVIEQASLTPVTDVIVYAGDYGVNGAAGWVNCPPAARQGTNRHGHRWCQGQELYFNLNARYGGYFGDVASRDYMACHEMGHTVGLRHWGNPPRSEWPAAPTCMQPDEPNGPTTLDIHDRDHLDAYYAPDVVLRSYGFRTPVRGLRMAADLPSRLLGG
jgi:hypothetical protein